MFISNYHIQSILRTYGNRLSKGVRTDKSRKTDKVEWENSVKISIMACQRHMIEGIDQDRAINQDSDDAPERF